MIMTKENIKKLIPQIIKVLAFVLAFIIILQALSVNVFSGEKTSQVSKKRADSFSFLSDPENTTDIVCLGSSDMWSGFVPTHLWETYGYTSVVSSFSHQSISQAQTLLESIRKVQDPKLVILEIDTLYDGRSPSDVINPGTSDYEHFFEVVSPDAFEETIEDKFSIFTFHNIWKDYQKKSKRKKYAHGYLYNKTVKKLKPREYMIETDERDIPIATNSNSLREFAKYCKNNDIQLLFLEMPSFSSWTYARHNAVQDLSDELGVTLLDLNFKYDEIGISITNCFRDNGNHLNYAAACKVTEYVGAYIRDNYDIQDRLDQTEVAEYWNNDVIEFKKFNKIKD